MSDLKVKVGAIVAIQNLSFLTYIAIYLLCDFANRLELSVDLVWTIQKF